VRLSERPGNESLEQKKTISKIKLKIESKKLKINKKYLGPAPVTTVTVVESLRERDDEIEGERLGADDRLTKKNQN